MPGNEVQRICPDESNFEVFSPGLVVHTMRAEEMADPAATLRKVFGQGDSRVVFEHALACGRCPEGASSGASVSTALDGREYSVGVLFPGKGEDPDVYRVRVQEMRSVPASGKKDGSTAGVIPPTLLNVPVRCPRGHVGVVTHLLSKARFDPLNAYALVCGPEIMIRFAVQERQRLGVSDDRIFVSMERNMKCGIGLCGHCQ